MYRYNLLGSIIKYTMGSIVFINGNYFLRRYASTTSTANIMMTSMYTGRCYSALDMVRGVR